MLFRSLELTVRRRGETESHLERITIGPNRFRTLGLWMDIGRITSVAHNSPAEQCGIEVGDKILRVNDKEVGTAVDPLKLPDFLASFHGQELTIVVQRDVKGADSKEIEKRLIPADKPGWVERPYAKDHPLSVPAIGVAFAVIPTILKEIGRAHV